MANSNVDLAPKLTLSCFEDLERFFGPPPILSDESAEDYRAIGQAIWDARPPEDFIQATRVNDITYLLWEGSRLRRLKVKLIEASKVEGAKTLMKRLSPDYLDSDFWKNWALGEEEHVVFVDNILSAADLDQSAIFAQTIEVIINTLETIERQAAQFEARRLVTLRDYDQYSDNAERRRELSQTRVKQISGRRTAKTKQNLEKDAQHSPQLPLDLEAAE